VTHGPEHPLANEHELTIEAEVRDSWENMVPDYIRRGIAEHNGVDMEGAYEIWAIGQRESIVRRRRLRIQCFAYYDFDVLTGAASCPHCGWSGPTRGNYEVTHDLIAVECPACGDLLVTVELPTADQITAAAQAGNAHAQADLELIENARARSSEFAGDGLDVTLAELDRFAEADAGAHAKDGSR
jgi:hypothetical protein